MRLRGATIDENYVRCSADRCFGRSAAFRLGAPKLPQTCQKTSGLRYTVL